ncbi:hypothetical protein N0B16_03730 [Chryseobacterium sp. GMJ5]|uniref:Uncharacterized protein n=1 Tax=Chryseobacterium gilvum TaxID=2976534 RepID=A0ABT2VV96_9FLAO|nr:hypothetical protein [Chryseobacterium gilvum]MCU7613538.1 hypothetical protein [Chryseobacterium gilvum]
MKIKLLVFASLFLCLFAHSQTKVNTDEVAIKKTLTYFVNSIKSKKIDQAVNCIYPKFFTVVPKDQMIQILTMTYNNPFMKIEIQDLQFGSVEKPEFINGEYFSIITYYTKLKCDVSSLDDNMKKKIEGAITKKYGKSRVQYSKNEDTYLVNANMTACAVSKDRKTWKLVILEKESKSKLMKVLPKKILDKI